VYRDWATQVVPALHAADAAAVAAWIADDRVGVAHDKQAGPLATRALATLVMGPGGNRPSTPSLGHDAVAIARALLKAGARPTETWDMEGAGVHGVTLMMQVTSLYAHS
jgi:hypothetical protein